MDQKFFHSVRLDKEKCKGCTNCLKRCPTEAIRVRGGRAHIINERCIDCGECIRVCDYHAKYAQTDPLASINRFKYKIALPAPSLYGQFKHLISASQVLEGLLKLGFDDVFEVAEGADIVTRAIRERMRGMGRDRYPRHLFGVPGHRAFDPRALSGADSTHHRRASAHGGGRHGRPPRVSAARMTQIRRRSGAFSSRPARPR